MTRLARPALLLAATSALLLSACGGGGGASSPDADAGSGGETGSAGAALTPVTVGGLPILPSAGLQYGIDQGIFEEHGLDVTLEMSQSGAALIPSVVAGDYDFGTSNTVSIMVALDAGLPIQVTSGFVTALPEGDDISGVYTTPGSGIEGPADLAGRTVAVNALNSVGPLTIREVVRQAGGDPETIEFVELAYPDMPAALDSGQVDAVWEVEPFVTRVEQDGAELVTSNFQELAPGVPTMVMIASADQDPALVEQFNTALTDVLTRVSADEEGLRETIPTLLEMDAELANAVRLERFDTAIDTDLVQVLADLALADEFVANPVDITQFES